MRIRRRELLIGAGASAVAGEAAARGRRLALSGGSVVGPTPPGSPFTIIGGTTVGSPKGDGGDLYRGGQVVIGSQPITITALGRWVGTLNGSVHTHTLGIYQQQLDPITNTNPGVLLGVNVTVDISAGTPGTYQYASLPAGIVLWPGQTYFIMSFEPGSGAGDIWYGGNSLTTTADASWGQAATLDPSNGNTQTFSEPPWVPVNFQYNVGTTGNLTAQGSVGFSQFVLNQPAAFSPSIPSVVTGTITLDGSWSHGSPGAGNQWTYQWWLDGAPYGPVLTGTQGSGSPDGSVLPWVGFDSTLVADGTHHAFARIYDDLQTPYYGQVSQGVSFVVANGGVVSTGAQTIPSASFSSVKAVGPIPDTVHYDGTPYPVHTPHSISYNFIAPSSSSIYRSASEWYGEIWTGTRQSEYQWHLQFGTTASGGVLVQSLDSLLGTSVAGSYNDLEAQNIARDGTRLNAVVSPYSTYTEDPAGGGKWWFCEIAGRVGSITASGGVVTLVGGRKDTSALDAAAILVGNWPPDINFGGANDLCFRPSNPNKLLVVAQVDNWIGEIDIPTATVTVFAGVPGGSGYTEGAAVPVQTTGSISGFAMTVASGTGVATGKVVGGENVLPGTHIVSGSGTSWTVDDPTHSSQSVPGGTTLYIGAASFDAPTSIIMSDGTGNAGPIDTMYVVDQNNNAIRKITPAGVVSTLCGGTVSSGALPGDFFGTTAHPVGTGSITWHSGPNTGSVVMQNPTTIALGMTLFLTGSVNTGGSGTDSANSIHGANSDLPQYFVTGFTDNQHFEIALAAIKGIPDGTVIGTLTGTMTLTSLNCDLYSQPTIAAFASTYCAVPMNIKFTSAGNIVMSELGIYGCRLIDLASSTISRITCFNGVPEPASSGWIWQGCDRLGKIGPVDDIKLAAFNDRYSAAHTVWQSSLAQSQSPSIGIGAIQNTFLTDSDNLGNYAPATLILGGFGHYPWAVAISEHEGRMVGTGGASFHPVFLRFKQGGDPGPDLKTLVFNDGLSVMASGTATGFPWELRPAFYALWGQNGAPWIGSRMDGNNTFEDLAANFPSTAFGDSGSVGLGNYIRAGMGGSVPRPELTGNADRDLQYFIYRGTVAGGGGFGGSVYQPGANDPDIVTPLITSISAVRGSPTPLGYPTITVTWTTNKPTVGIACAGTPNQFSLFGIYPMYSQMSAPGGTYGTSHSATTQVLTGLTPVHYTVVVKDAAGNFAHALDQTIT